MNLARFLMTVIVTGLLLAASVQCGYKIGKIKADEWYAAHEYRQIFKQADEEICMPTDGQPCIYVFGSDNSFEIIKKEKP